MGLNWEKRLPPGTSAEAKAYLGGLRKSNRNRIIKRMSKKGVESWRPESRAPHRHPNRITFEVESLINEGQSLHPMATINELHTRLLEKGHHVPVATIRKHFLRRALEQGEVVITLIQKARALEHEIIKSGRRPTLAEVEFIRRWGNPRFRFFNAPLPLLPGKRILAFIHGYRTNPAAVENPPTIHVEIYFDEISGWCAPDFFAGPNSLNYFERSQYNLVCPSWHPAPMTLLPDVQLERMIGPRRFPPGIKFLAVAQHIMKRASQCESTLLWIHLWNWLYRAVRIYNNTPITSFPNLGLSPQQYMDKYRPQVEALGKNSFDQAFAISRCKPPRLGEGRRWDCLDLRRKAPGSNRRRTPRAEREPITFYAEGAGKQTVQEMFRLARQRKEPVKVLGAPSLSQAT